MNLILCTTFILSDLLIFQTRLIKTYIGCTTKLDERLEKHNLGGSFHTKKYKPWVLVTYVVFDSKQKALDFEKYIKSGSGHAFAKKRLWYSVFD